MVVISLFLYICPYTLCKIFNTYGICLACFLAPVSCRCFAHKPHSRKAIDHAVLYEIKVLTGIFPFFSILFFKSTFEFFELIFFTKSSFQICYMGHRSAKSLHLIKNFQKHINYSVFILLST